MYNLIIVGVTLTALYNVFFKKGLYPGLKWMIICFFLGYRTLTLAPGFLIHPIDIIIVALVLKASFSPNLVRSTYPTWLFVLFPFCLLALGIGLLGTSRTNSVWFEFKNFILIFPLFFIIDKFLKRDEDLHKLAWISVLTITAIAIFGLLEYYLPPFRSLLGGFYNPNKAAFRIKEEGFQRAAFTFWGAVVVGHIMISLLPLLLLIPKQKKLFGSHRNLAFVLLILNLGAIYITGNRADWLTALVLFGMFYFSYLGRKLNFGQMLATMTIALLGGIYLISNLSTSFILRFQSGINAIISRKRTYDALDSSGYVRQQRMLGALETISENPLGVGWSRSGWVHSDFLQVMANTGWIPGLIFFMAFIGLGIRSFRLLRNILLTSREKDIINVLLMCYTSTGIMLLINNNYVLTQTGVPLFLIWALLHVYITKLQRELHVRTQISSNSSNQRVAAYLQQ